jgi:hypothetical protein
MGPEVTGIPLASHHHPRTAGRARRFLPCAIGWRSTSVMAELPVAAALSTRTGQSRSTPMSSPCDGASRHVDLFLALPPRDQVSYPLLSAILHDQACIFSLPYICFITIQGMQLERLLQEWRRKQSLFTSFSFSSLLLLEAQTRFIW